MAVRLLQTAAIPAELWRDAHLLKLPPELECAYPEVLEATGPDPEKGSRRYLDTIGLECRRLIQRGFVVTPI